MLSKLIVSTCVATAATMAALTGCQHAHPETTQASSTSAAVPARAIVVTPANGGGTTVFLATNDPNNPTALCAAGSGDVCPECKAAAAKYFLTGVLDPKCSRTGATRTPVTAASGNFYHQ